ncbi:MAG: DUF983 domain-containing protein [bacterium]
MKYYPPISPLTAGFGCKCPRCGQGDLYNGFLSLKKSCDNCQLDYSKADSGDGPAVFMLFIVGFVAVIVMFIARFAFYAPAWLALLFGILSMVFLIMTLMRPLKALMIAMQYQHKAIQDRPGEKGSDWT